MDIYFDDQYGKLYEKIEKGKLKTFFYECEYGKVKHSFIYRPIKNTNLYDIVTPYGYGGPIILESNGSKELLVNNFMNEFEKYCFDHKIVSEFIRFHPIINNVADFGRIYGATFDRYTVGTDLETYEDPVKSEFSKRCRKNIRQALNKGVSMRVLLNPSDISVFKNIYYSTMERNIASEYYYFDDEYFRGLLEVCQGKLLLIEAIFQGKTIAAGLYLLSDERIHIHLSGTLSEYLYLSPAYILRYAVTVWGKENGYKMIHHGGGRSSSVDDGLYKFKEQFGLNTKFEFYIGKKIWNEDAYKKLSLKAGVEFTGSLEGYFPIYRSR